MTFLLSCLILFSRNVFCRRPDLGPPEYPARKLVSFAAIRMTSQDASKKK